MKIVQVRHAWPEKKGFSLYRKNGTDNYTFLHFWKPVRLLVGGEEIVTEPNAVIVYAPGTPHKFVSPDCDVMHDWFHAEGDDFALLLAAADLKPDTVYYPCDYGAVTEIVAAIENEFFSPREFSQKLIEHYVAVLFLLIASDLARHGAAGPAVDLRTRDEFKRLRARILSDLPGDWSVARMAAEVGLSESRFFALYKAVFKTSPGRDLALARMDYAKLLLSRDPSLPVTQAAELCGYSNEFHFIRRFKKFVGMTPKQFSILHRS